MPGRGKLFELLLIVAINPARIYTNVALLKTINTLIKKYIFDSGLFKFILMQKWLFFQKMIGHIKREHRNRNDPNGEINGRRMT